MRARFKLPRPGHGTVVAYLALFIALGGAPTRLRISAARRSGPSSSRAVP